MNCNFYFGIDIGGTDIKGAVIDCVGNIVKSGKIPTESEKGCERVVANVKALCESLLLKSDIKKERVKALGLGVPGMVDSKSGTVILAKNLNFVNFKIKDAVEKALGLPVKVGNDANVAALGEMKFGYKGAYKNMVMLTLGTGVGGGIVIDGELYEGNLGAGAEMGHSVVVMGGEPCSCGRRGCIEAYASATALIRDTRRAMENHKDSLLWEIGSADAVSGKTPFDYMDKDVYAREVVDNYVKTLACYITNIANVLRPEAVILGGGVCAQGDNLLIPLKKLVNSEVFAGTEGPGVEILTAKLGNDAGCLGAAALVMQKK